MSAPVARAPAGHLLRLECALLAGGIGLVTLLCWVYLVGGAAPTMHASGSGFAVGLPMWAVMMCGMMLPSAAPMLLAYQRVSGRTPPGHLPRTVLFAVAYLALWVGVSVLGAAAQAGLHAAGLLAHSGASARSPLSGGLLLTAGAYQLSPVKQACLYRCRTPMAFMMTEWRPGLRRALAMGLRHGIECVLCCWAVMSLMFVLGMAKLFWMGALTVFMLAEKTLPHGRRIDVVAGYGCLAWGLWVLTRAG